MRRIEAKYSRYRDDSVTTRINRAAGGAPVTIDAETAALLRYAEQCHAQSGGLFDITSGVLRRVWDFKPRAAGAARRPRNSRQPSRWSAGRASSGTRRRSACRAPAWRSTSAASARSTRPTASPRSVSSTACGTDSSTWAATFARSVRRPTARRGASASASAAPNAAIAGFDLATGALATSGDYERYFEIDGQRYCHILNPKPGMPVTHWQSISVVSPLCVVAGSCATIAMLLEAGGAAFLDAQGVQWLGVARRRIIAPRGIMT